MSLIRGQLKDIGRDYYTHTFVQLDLLQHSLKMSSYLNYIILTSFRASIFNIVKELDPIGLQRRTNNMQRHREEYIVPGPDYIWSLDGHDKLSDWGIEIYAAIDAYSWFIVWIYVGISNQTQQSVVVQYNNTIAQTGYHPRIIQTDCRKETLLMAELHFLVAWTSEPGIKLEDCYFYSTS